MALETGPRKRGTTCEFLIVRELACMWSFRFSNGEVRRCRDRSIPESCCGEVVYRFLERRPARSVIAGCSGQLWELWHAILYCQLGFNAKAQRREDAKDLGCRNSEVGEPMKMKRI